MLRTRIITALCLLGAFLAVYFTGSAFVWLGMCAVIAGTAGWEWARMTPLAPGAVYYGLSCAGIVIMMGWPGRSAEGSVLLWLVSVLFWIVCVPLWMRTRWVLKSPALAAIVGGIVIISSTLALNFLGGYKIELLLLLLIPVWIADIAAYFAGRAFGRHKLAPNISPGKTWEGVVGALLAVLLYGLLVGAWAVWHDGRAGEGPNLLQWLLLAVLLMVYTGLSILGDLFESLMKRQAGVKDSSHLLPGHGGVLDRIDSLTSTLPLIAFLLASVVV